jgi:glyoxylate carboligase
MFGYPGGAVLPIYDEMFQQDEVEHILVRHEQGAAMRPKAMPAPPACRLRAGDLRSRRHQW